jgi:hypothetical protein
VFRYLLSCATLLCISGLCDQSRIATQAPVCQPPFACTSPVMYAPAFNSQAVTPKSEQVIPDGFSELTLFLFGSGLALFVALLGWSEQIRGINKDTRAMEKTFLEATKINRRDFLSVVKSKSPDDQLVALTAILASGKATTVASVEVLQIFKTWHRKWTTLERLSAWKYRLSVILTYTLFAAGNLSLFVSPHTELSLLHFRARVILLILVIPMAGFLTILTIIAVANYKESNFHELLNLLSEKV